MPYCSSDQKFAGYDEPTVEIESEEVTDEEAIFSVRVVRPCASCGQDVAEATLEFSLGLTDHSDTCSGTTLSPEDDDREYTIESSDAEPVDDYQTKDRKGNPIKNSRYQKHLIGATVTATIKCSLCGETFDVTGTDTVQASEFDMESSH